MLDVATDCPIGIGPGGMPMAKDLPSYTLIENPAHPSLDSFRTLTRPDAGHMVVEGYTALERLVLAGHTPLAILATPQGAERVRRLVPAEVPRLVASAAVVRDVVGFAFHRGMLALAPRPTYMPPAQPRLVVLGEQITDPSNVGALIRNCRALGADALWLDAACGDPFSRKAIRASMGLSFSLPVAQGALAPYLDTLPKHARVAATCHGAIAVQDFTWPRQCILMVGNEGVGLSSKFLSTATHRVYIPMRHGVDSLNVAAATAVLLHDYGTSSKRAQRRPSRHQVQSQTES